jgi:hypothetical protein
MNDPDIRTLLEKYYSGDTTLEEERTLEDFFTAGTKTDDLQAERILFQGRRAYRKVSAPVMPSFMRHRSRVWQAVGVAACLTAVFLIIRIWITISPSIHEGNGQQAGIQQILAKSLYETSGTQRLLVVDRVATEVTDPGPDLIKAVGAILLQDQNPAVRMAAANVLSSYPMDSNITLILSQAVAQENDPVVKIVLIELMLPINPKSAVDAAGNLLEDPDVPEDMKDVVKNL